MTYPELALAFLAAAVLVGLALPLAQRRRPRTWPRWSAVGVTAVALVVLTAVFDSLMIAAGLFHYEPGALAGLHLGLAPVEDFAYPLATAILLPALWVTLVRPRASAPAAIDGDHHLAPAERSPSRGPGR
ncbi:MAG: lycopene cyclase domain-containing protein, partial [Actinomycetota bacterium]|nr:lycopene cyclase domain-containing protein [Actinomycetota bacterium]